MSWDKKITAAFVLAVLVQSGGALMWAGGAAERINTIETELALRRSVMDRMVRVEVELKLAREQLDRIERKVEARGDRSAVD
jgi:hypothetical protein